MQVFFMKFSGRFILAAIVFWITATAANAADRVALVIGNSAYQYTTVLKNPANDANLIAQSLKDEGFDVIKIVDADLETMLSALIEFKTTVQSGPEASLIYFAGHGAQISGQNYLIPVDADIANEANLSTKAINLDMVLSLMGDASSKINIVLLDASRENPFNSQSPPDRRGLAGFYAPRGPYFIGFAAAPGSIALDGDGDNSPYALAVSEMMKKPDIEIGKMFSFVRRQVMKSTNAKQIPWENSSFGGEFRFHPQQD